MAQFGTKYLADCSRRFIQSFHKTRQDRLVLAGFIHNDDVTHFFKFLTNEMAHFFKFLTNEMAHFFMMNFSQAIDYVLLWKYNI